MTAPRPGGGTYGAGVYNPGPASQAHPPAVQRGLPNQQAAHLRPHTARPAVNFLTVAEVAAELRVSKMTVYRLIHGEQLGAVRVGRSYRVPERSVDKYVQEHGA